MNCKHCGEENSEEAVFCRKCGKRLDGMIICPACGNKLPDDSAFCTQCGAKIASVPQPEYSYSETAVADDETLNKDGTSQSKNYLGTILKYAAASAAILTALFSLIFVFCIGVNANVTGTDLMNVGSSESHSIYYFFGNAYKDVNNALKSVEDYTQLYAWSQRLPVIIGTVIAAGTLISVVVLSVLSIARTVMNVMGKTEKKGGSLAIAAFMSFVLGSVLLLSLQNEANASIKATANGTNMYMHATVGLNGATVTGIVLGAICGAVYIGCTIAQRGKALLNVKTLIRCAFALVSLSFVIVVLVMLARPSYGVGVGYLDDMASESNYASKMTYSIKVNVTSILSMLGAMCQTTLARTTIDNEVVIFILLSVALVSMVATAIFATYYFVKRVETVTDKNEDLLPAIAMTFAALIFMISAIIAITLFKNELKDIEGMAEIGLTFTFVVPIITFVFSALTLGVSIAEEKVRF